MSLPNPVDLDFISIRHNLLDLAAFLDRVDTTGHNGDYRVRALKSALPLLHGDGPDRAKRILEHFSDPTSAPIEKAPSKGASGAAPEGIS
jgi:hypothetical protein